MSVEKLESCKFYLVFTEICDVGKEYNPIDDTCSACLKGFFKATAGSREKCEPCGLNMATAGRGADSCFGKYFFVYKKIGDIPRMTKDIILNEHESEILSVI